VADTLNRHTGTAEEYIRLARLIRFQSATSSIPNATMAAAMTLTELQDKIRLGINFGLRGLGEYWNLPAFTRGKVVVLNFCATSSEPCLEQFPVLQNLYRQFADYGLAVFAVSNEDASTVEEFVRRKGYRFQFLFYDRSLGFWFDIVGVPVTYIYDRDGRLVAQIPGTISEPQLRELLTKAGLK